MKSAVFVVVTLLALMGLAEPLAQASELTYKSIQCGDHWLKLDVSLDANSNRATLQFAGDSAPDPELIMGVYEFTNDYSLRVVVDSAAGTMLEIDGSDHEHDLYWGTYYPGNAGSETSLGLCSVE